LKNPAASESYRERELEGQGKLLFRLKSLGADATVQYSTKVISATKALLFKGKAIGISTCIQPQPKAIELSRLKENTFQTRFSKKF
jgi:hypothetical protein